MEALRLGQLAGDEGAGDGRAGVTEIQAAKSTAVLGVRFDGKVSDENYVCYC